MDIITRLLCFPLLMTPVFAWGICTSDINGTALVTQQHYNSRDICTAPTQITTENSVTVTSTGDVLFSAPKVSLAPGFRVEKGGAFIAGFAPPGVLTPSSAGRFLTQATFGPTQTDIDHLLMLGSYAAWIDEQLQLPVTLQLPPMRELNTRMCEDHPDYPETSNSLARHTVWWDQVLQGSDQLRQRVAFALSEILVVSDTAQLEGTQFGMTDYYDVLLRNAFGNYRQLLEEVTLHPMMGEWLSSIRNQKADPENNIHPDENFARELMQLFTIGVHELNLDGSLRLDLGGEPIATYGQDEIKEFARVFTGWIYSGVQDWWDFGDTTQPMVPLELFHDTDAKTLLTGVVLPAGQDTRTDLEGALDNVFAHPNVAPFISKQLIQRLVTSNPSSAYVQRIATVFNDNGQGVKGDLAAVVRAILLDTEARSLHSAEEGFGKLREPLLRYSHVWRAFGINKIQHQGQYWHPDETCGQAPYETYDVWWWLPDFRDVTGQAVLNAPSVFNFFAPNYMPQGPAMDAGLVAPEFQIATESLVINSLNGLDWQIQTSNDYTDVSVLDLAQEREWARNPGALLDRLNILLLNGEMSYPVRTILLEHLHNPYFSSGDFDSQRARLRDAIMLIVNTPDYLIQQ